ncbi:DUF4177 domain-containing protein [Marimonas sp. MJW-29]|uniref:DUF4177 domain-containing protein n=1 Tax=Sulfitobacter sediminis TaxID=3234186 RepID=A0ABV3RJD8_9RHOB
MPAYEYKVVPAPTKGLKARGVKGPEARFSHAIQTLMNDLAAHGWEYQRAETLPSVERSGLTSTTTEWRNLLVFRRVREDDAEAFAPELLPAPDAALAAPAGAGAATLEKKAGAPADATPEDPSPPVTGAPEATGATATDDGAARAPDEAARSTGADDNGVEDTRNVEGISSTLTSLADARKPRKTDA